MAEAFVGEIRMFGGAFAPRQWAFCNGQLMEVNQNQTLFSLYGTTYGGDGRTSFAVPDMRGRVPMQQGQGTGLTNRVIGQRFGTETVTLDLHQLPPHTHALMANSMPASPTNDPQNNVLAAGEQMYEPDQAAAQATMNEQSVEAVGGSAAHNNLMPYQCVSFIVALSGEYPSRN